MYAALTQYECSELADDEEGRRFTLKSGNLTAFVFSEKGAVVAADQDRLACRADAGGGSMLLWARTLYSLRDSATGHGLKETDSSHARFVERITRRLSQIQVLFLHNAMYNRNRHTL